MNNLFVEYYNNIVFPLLPIQMRLIVLLIMMSSLPGITGQTCPKISTCDQSGPSDQSAYQVRKTYNECLTGLDTAISTVDLNDMTDHEVCSFANETSTIRSNLRNEVRKTGSLLVKRFSRWWGGESTTTSPNTFAFYQSKYATKLDLSPNSREVCEMVMKKSTTSNKKVNFIAMLAKYF